MTTSTEWVPQQRIPRNTRINANKFISKQPSLLIFPRTRSRHIHNTSTFRLRVLLMFPQRTPHPRLFTPTHIHIITIVVYLLLIRVRFIISHRLTPNRLHVANLSFLPLRLIIPQLKFIVNNIAMCRLLPRIKATIPLPQSNITIQPLTAQVHPTTIPSITNTVTTHFMDTPNTPNSHHTICKMTRDYTAHSSPALLCVPGKPNIAIQMWTHRDTAGTIEDWTTQALRPPTQRMEWIYVMDPVKPWSWFRKSRQQSAERTDSDLEDADAKLEMGHAIYPDASSMRSPARPKPESVNMGSNDYDDINEMRGSGLTFSDIATGRISESEDLVDAQRIEEHGTHSGKRKHRERQQSSRQRKRISRPWEEEVEIVPEDSSDPDDLASLDDPSRLSRMYQDELLKYIVGLHQKRKALIKSFEKKNKKKMQKVYQRYLGPNAKTIEPLRVEADSEMVALPGPTEEEMLVEKARQEQQLEEKRHKIWLSIARNAIPKAQKVMQQTMAVKQSNHKKVALLCQREVKRSQTKGVKLAREIPLRARRAMREVLIFWKRNEKEERELRKKAEKEEQERRRIEEERREAKRQARKLNFLITQTELYSHFIGRKIQTDDDADPDGLAPADSEEVQPPGDVSFREIDFDEEDEEKLTLRARQSAQSALAKQLEQTKAFDEAARARRVEAEMEGKGGGGGSSMHLDQGTVDQMDFLNPSSLRGDSTIEQPRMLTCKLKAYQLKGLNWLANLYEQGINGILADEMGLGKTVQSISLMAYLAETNNIWGPFLVISPASTLHNWQQEVTKFAPHLKALPYWGNLKDRKVLRQFWNKKKLYTKDAPFHVLITSYQLVVSDERYFQRIKWQYMILDEAQAIKSSTSARWKTLLNFNCRNRLLLTGTPIQNSMQELWALLHFIMPTLFDSHEEFSEWFSKDIESHAENRGTLNEHQLRRLHMILKPFMLRRVKRDVENELGDKVELEIPCTLTPRQRRMYQGLKEKISVAELLDKVSSLSLDSLDGLDGGGGSVGDSLMNLVMQFRKVCNHPELFERAEVVSPLVMFPSLPALPPSCKPVPSSSAAATGGIGGKGSDGRASRGGVGSGSAAGGGMGIASVRSKDILLAPYNVRSPIRYKIPQRLYRSGLVCPVEFDQSWEVPSVHHRLRSVGKKFELWHPSYIQHDLFSWNGEGHLDNKADENSGMFSFLRFTDMSPKECSSLMGMDVLMRLLWHLSWVRRMETVLSYYLRNEESIPSRYSLLIAMQHELGIQRAGFDAIGPTSCMEHLCNVWASDPSLDTFPRLPSAYIPPVVVPPVAFECNDRGFVNDQQWILHDQFTKSILLGLAPLQRQHHRHHHHHHHHHRHHHHHHHGGASSDVGRYSTPAATKRVLIEEYVKSLPSSVVGMYGVPPTKQGFTKIVVPSMETLMTNSGKMMVLEKLLPKLKAEGHRVLIYFQMTKMIDLMEEYLTYRKYTYLRLDGSTTISERRDMVTDWQTRPDLFIFLLSTRAGGLGINLTAADTVIFYDSDWNPTVDQQAMDRAHRLGQTKQVTVYRLITTGTIEERILMRAKQKDQIQKVVISGGEFKQVDFRPKEVLSLLLDDEELE
ncbi:putative DNA helicase ino80, partial [Quaeritorhiza haematococci]